MSNTRQCQATDRKPHEQPSSFYCFFKRHQGIHKLFPRLLVSLQERNPWLRQLPSNITKDALVFCKQSFFQQTVDLHFAFQRARAMPVQPILLSSATKAHVIFRLVWYPACYGKIPPLTQHTIPYRSRGLSMQLVTSRSLDREIPSPPLQPAVDMRSHTAQ